jgi:hypothetical protein
LLHGSHKWSKNGAKEKQRKSFSHRGSNDRHKDHDKDVKQLLFAFETNRAGELLVSIQQSLMRAGTMPLLSAARTTLLTDNGGTTPSATCEAIAEAAPELDRAFRPERVLAVCDEIRHSDFRPKQAFGPISYHRFALLEQTTKTDHPS